MKKLCIALALVACLMSCELQNHLDQQQVSNQAPLTGNSEQLIEVDRILPEGGIRANESGPASMPEGAERSAISKTEASSLWFEPNAGAIWYEASTGKTHLMALQLPGGDGEVKYASLGWGWQGATHMSMDRYNFYVVWKNTIYSIPKTSADYWVKVVVNNGKEITGVAGLPDGAYGFDFSRVAEGQKSIFYHYTYGTYYSFGAPNCGGCVWVGTDVNGLALYKQTDNENALMHVDPYSLSYFEYDPNKPIDMYGNFPNTYYVASGGGNAPKSAAGNPVTQSFFYSKPSIELGSPQIYEFKSPTYKKIPFSYIKYSPVTAPLVVNNGYVWIMGNTLQRLMTLGSQRGNSNFNAYGWSGISLACADPSLVF